MLINAIILDIKSEYIIILIVNITIIYGVNSLLFCFIFFLSLFITSSLFLSFSFNPSSKIFFTIASAIKSMIIGITIFPKICKDICIKHFYCIF